MAELPRQSAALFSVFDQTGALIYQSQPVKLGRVVDGQVIDFALGVTRPGPWPYRLTVRFIIGEASDG
jgi:hypothetical protein